MSATITPDGIVVRDIRWRGTEGAAVFVDDFVFYINSAGNYWGGIIREWSIHDSRPRYARESGLLGTTEFVVEFRYLVSHDEQVRFLTAHVYSTACRVDWMDNSPPTLGPLPAKYAGAIQAHLEHTAKDLSNTL